MDKTQVIESLKSAYLFLEGAGKILDLKNGEGYAATHPEQVAAFTLTAALDYHARKITGLLGELVESQGSLPGEA